MSGCGLAIITMKITAITCVGVSVYVCMYVQASSKCLTEMICSADKLFKVSE